MKSAMEQLGLTPENLDRMSSDELTEVSRQHPELFDQACQEYAAFCERIVTPKLHTLH